jgi:NifU-like protein involved in Fe-S cluster formation
MKFPYTEKVLEHFRNPKNVGKLEDADGKGLEGSPAVEIWLQYTLK